LPGHYFKAPVVPAGSASITSAPEILVPEYDRPIRTSRHHFFNMRPENTKESILSVALTKADKPIATTMDRAQRSNSGRPRLSARPVIPK